MLHEVCRITRDENHRVQFLVVGRGTIKQCQEMADRLDLESVVPAIFVVRAARKNILTQRCADCGERGVSTGHQECQYPQDHD